VEKEESSILRKRGDELNKWWWHCSFHVPHRHRDRPMALFPRSCVDCTLWLYLLYGQRFQFLNSTKESQLATSLLYGDTTKIDWQPSVRKERMKVNALIEILLTPHEVPAYRDVVPLTFLPRNVT
jgi:hypothetical protein